jgi:hypothetical protein
MHTNVLVCIALFKLMQGIRHVAPLALIILIPIHSVFVAVP